MLGVSAFDIQIGKIFEAHELVIMKARSLVPRSIGVLIDFDIGDGAAGIIGDPEGSVKFVFADGGLGVPFFVFAKAVFCR